MNNPIFDNVKSLHPDWSDEKVWAEVSLQMQADKVVEDCNGDVDPNDPGILEHIIRGAGDWLEEVLPQVFSKVEALFHQLLNRISEWIKKGLQAVFEYIGDFFL